MKFHEASKLFPLLEGDDFKSFAADIKENGLQNPIKTFHGEILDGRNRYRACKEVGVKPEYEEVSPDDPVSYVLSLNLHHRHLNESQRAMVAARVRPHFEKLAKERQRVHGDTAPGRVKNTHGQLAHTDKTLRANWPQGFTRVKIPSIRRSWRGVERLASIG